jgi:Sec-independent protein translocase protein TatA
MSQPASVAHLARGAIGLPELLVIFAVVLTLSGVYRLRG